jgi:hypothetical protein
MGFFQSNGGAVFVPLWEEVRRAGQTVKVKMSRFFTLGYQG